MGSVDQVIPQDIYQALRASVSSPSSSNAFATIADLAGGGNDIFGNDGTFGAGRLAKITDTLTFENIAGVDRFIWKENGQIGTGAGIAASTAVATFGQWHQSSGFTTGFAFYATNATSQGLTVQMLGTTSKGIEIATQSNPTGTVTGARASISSTAATTNIGFHGVAKNGSSEGVGLFGEIGGSSTIVSSLGKKAVKGLANTTLDEDQFGGDFFSQEGSSGTVYTGNFWGARARSFGGTNIGNTLTSIGFECSAVNGQDNIAFLIPNTGNDGFAVIGADSVSGTSMVQLTGDLEYLDNTKGPIFKDRTNGNRYRLYFDAGLLSQEIVV